MARLLATAGATVVTVLLLASPAPVASAGVPVGERSLSVVQSSIPADWRERMLLRVNAVRAKAGSPPVRLCPALTTSAERYARQMAREDRFSHTDADGSTTEQRIAGAGYRPVFVGENLAAGQPTVAAAIGDWRRSASHYAAMTNPGFRHVGFGYERGRSPRYATFWVQHFGAGGRC